MVNVYVVTIGSIRLRERGKIGFNGVKLREHPPWPVAGDDENWKEAFRLKRWFVHGGPEQRELEPGDELAAACRSVEVWSLIVQERARR